MNHKRENRNMSNYYVLLIHSINLTPTQQIQNATIFWQTIYRYCNPVLINYYYDIPNDYYELYYERSVIPTPLSTIQNYTSTNYYSHLKNKRKHTFYRWAPSKGANSAKAHQINHWLIEIDENLYFFVIGNWFCSTS